MSKLSIFLIILELLLSGPVEAARKRGAHETESGKAAPVSTPQRQAKAPAAKGASSENSPQSGGSKSSAHSRASLYKPTTEFADPTPDTSFEKLMSLSDPQVALSFLNAFVPDFQQDPLLHLESQSLNLPSLPSIASKRVRMDFHARTKSGIHINIEMQVAREKYFDERAVFYAAGIFVEQIRESHVTGHAEWEGCLRPAYGVHILGYDSNALRSWKVTDPLAQRVKNNPLPKDDYIKHYRLQEAKTGQVIPLLQLIQIELPRVKQVLFPPRADFTAQEWWLSLFKHYDLYTENLINQWKKKRIILPDYIKEALRRLRLSSWSELDIENYGKELLLLREHATELAQEREQAFLEGEEKGRGEERREMVRAMKAQGMSVEQIGLIARISVPEVERLLATPGSLDDPAASSSQ